MTPFLIFPSLCLCSVAVLFCTSELKETWQGFCIRTTFVDKPTDSWANPNAQSCEHSRFSYLMRRWHFRQPCFLQDSNRCQARLLLTSWHHQDLMFTVFSQLAPYVSHHSKLLFTERTLTQTTDGMCVMCVCQDEVQELNRRLTTIDCRLRKSELSRKNLEITNKKLLGFAQVPL